MNNASYLKDHVSSTDQSSKSHARLKKLAWFLDSSIPVPGLGMRVGLDGIIGLIPGIGDAAGSIISSYIVAEAARMGVPKTTLLQMGFNIVIESLIGLIPIVGDIFDFTWKSNQRNIELLERYLNRPQETEKSSRMTVGVVIAVLVLVLIAIVYTSFAFFGWLFGAVA